VQREAPNVTPLPTLRREFPLNDVGNALRIKARHGRDLRYCHPWGCWLAWMGSHWQRDDIGYAEHCAKETLRQLAADLAEMEDDQARKQLARHIARSEDAQRIRGAVFLLRSDLPVVPDQFDADPWVLNCANGTIDLRTGGLRPHSRRDLITKMSPVAYDPDAIPLRWITFLEEILPDPAVRSFVQRLCGYSLTGVTSEQVLTIFYGGGANGKSTFNETLLRILGDYAQTAPAETFLDRRDGIPNDVARLRGARFVSASELGEGRRLNEALVKRMTGGDTIVARFMRAEWFEFTPTFKAVLVTNHRPEIRGTDEAIWRRIRLVPFTVTIPAERRDPELPAKLESEAAGVLAWAVEGCLDWQRNGLGAPEAVTAATADYRGDMDVLGGFLEDCCRIGDGLRAKASELYTRYGYWCTTNGETNGLSAKAFGLRLAERGFTSHRGTGGTREWLGLTLHDPESDA
jgi:putative DNA primase/helicase